MSAYRRLHTFFLSLDLCIPTCCRYWGYCCPWPHSMTHTLGRTPLDAWSARRWDLYVTTQHNTTQHLLGLRVWTLPRAGFEPAVPASKRQQTHALERAATGIGRLHTMIWDVDIVSLNPARFWRKFVWQTLTTGAHKFLIHGGDVCLLGENIYNIKKTTEALLVVTNEANLEVNGQKPKYNAHISPTECRTEPLHEDSKSFQDVAKFKYLETALAFIKEIRADGVEYRVLRKMFGHKREEIRGGLTKSDTEELHEFVEIPLSTLKQWFRFLNSY